MPFPAVHPALARALTAQGYAEPTPVQLAVLEAEPTRDLLVSAQTGSGKTVAFGLGAAGSLLGEAQKFDRAGPPLALVIAPTRELAQQVAAELTWLYAEAGAIVATCVGGMDPRREQRALSAGSHIVVGTPGRLKDHLERGNLDPSALRVVVLDEADEMLDLGFRDDLEEILDQAPPGRRTLLFSATIAREIAALAKRYQKDALRIDTTRRDEPHGDIEYRAIRTAPNEVEHAIVNLLRYFDAPSALIFCSTREAVRHLYGALRERGFSAVQLSGELSQKERNDALQAMRDGHARACVATDVAARGLDLPALDLVIHADLPNSKATLLHRSGRTGRAGRKGVSIVVVPVTRRRKAELLISQAGVQATWGPAPSAEEIRAKDEQRLIEGSLLNDAPSDEDLALGARLLEGRAPEVVAAALAKLYRSRLPEPEELFAAPEGPPPRSERPERMERPDWKPRSDGDTVWFRIPLGHSKNADPKWILPMICNMGHVTKRDIGAIRIFHQETRFEIRTEVVDRFREAAAAAAAAGEVRIDESSQPEAGERQHPPKHRPGQHRPGGPPRGPGGPSGPPRGPRGAGGPPRDSSAPPRDGPPRSRDAGGPPRDGPPRRGPPKGKPRRDG